MAILGFVFVLPPVRWVADVSHEHREQVGAKGTAYEAVLQKRREGRPNGAVLRSMACLTGTKQGEALEFFLKIG
jgi:hypothetical protein